MTRYHLLDADTDPEGVADRVGRQLASAPVDVAFVSIGENGHLAFNDPPADFATERPSLIVQLDDACRRQQVADRRKAEAVRACFEGDISPMVPASILRSHDNTTAFLDRDSAALLKSSTRGDILTADTA